MKAVKLLTGPKFIHVMAEKDVINHMWSLFSESQLGSGVLIIFDGIHDVVGDQDEPHYKEMVSFLGRMTAFVESLRKLQE